MNAEFLASMEYWEREKGLDREILISAVEDALLSAAKRAAGPARAALRLCIKYIGVCTLRYIETQTHSNHLYKT